jgi:hypothetical protein
VTTTALGWRRRLARIVALGGLAGTALLFSGCVKADVDLTVHGNDQIDGNIVMAIDRAYESPNGQPPGVLLDQVTQRVFSGTATGAVQEPYADSEYVGRRVVITGMTLLDFNRGTGDGGMKIVHQGGQFHLSGTVDTVSLAPPAGQQPSATSELIARTYDVMIRVTFPGAVTTANGAIAGDTVTWRPRLGQRSDLMAVADDSPGLPAWLLPAVLAGLVLAAGAAVAWRVGASSRQSGHPA